MNKHKDALDFVIKKFLEWKESGNIFQDGIDPFSLEKFGVDCSKKKIVLGNLVLKKDLITSKNYSVNLINKHNDLYANPISERSDLIKMLQNKWSQGIKKIDYIELQSFNIWTPLDKIIIGNFKLTSGLFDNGKFTIALNDPKRNEYNRLLDNWVNLHSVQNVLSKFKAPENSLKMSEVQLNGILLEYFRLHFENVSKSTGNLKGLFDLSIGNLSFVIELKLAKAAARTDQRDRAYGQMKRYIEEFSVVNSTKSDNFMLMVAGEEKLKQEENIKALKKGAEQDFKMNFYFLALD